MPTVHILGNLLLFAACGFIGWRLSRRKWTALIGIGLSGLAAFLSVLLAVRPGLIVAVVPYRDLTFYDNLYPLAIVLFVPCVWWFVKTRPQRIRMVVWSVVLAAMALIPYDYHLAPLSVSGGTFLDDNGVCRQTSDYNCSAASVVTLLNHYGVPATEADVIELARTKDGKGTEALGIYRALRHYEKQMPGYQARLKHQPLEKLLQHGGPAIVLAGLPSGPGTHNAAAYGRDNNWIPGFYHDVVFLGPDPDRENHVLIADPDMGLESWPLADFRFLYRGQALVYDAL